MKNKEIIDKRYAVADKMLKRCRRQFKGIYTDIYDDLLFISSFIEIEPRDLNLTVSSQVKRYVNKKIKEWKENGIVEGYFAYMVSNFKKYTYANVIEILVYGAYYEKLKESNKVCKSAFKEVANTAYEQAKEEAPRKLRKWEELTWPIISTTMLFLPSVNKTFSQYLELIFMTNAQEAFRCLNNTKQQGIILSKDGLLNLLNKQIKRVVNINELKNGVVKFSGLLDDIFSSLINQVYLFPFRKDKNVRVRFVAVIDNRTTDMCRSLNNQEFYVNRENEFYRYSAEAGGEVKIKVQGLVSGVNLPPITDHYHHCRSSIKYL